MKKIILYIVAVASLLMSCKEDVEKEDLAGKEIKLKATVRGISLKSAVDSISQMSPIGIFAAIAGEWGPSDVLISNDQSTLSTGGDISFTGLYFYPEDGSFVDFYTYHPHAPIGTSGANYVTTPSVNNPPVLHFTITGQEDIMFSYHEYGSATVVPDPFTFLHKLTQLKFVSVATPPFLSGVTITSITINGVNTTCTMDISDGDMGTWGTPANVVVPIINGGAINLTPTNVGAPVMLEPDNSSFTITVVTSQGTYSGIAITPDNDSTFEEGKAYTITLTFIANEITMVAALTPWDDTGVGSGSITLQ